MRGQLAFDCSRIAIFSAKGELWLTRPDDAREKLMKVRCLAFANSATADSQSTESSNGDGLSNAELLRRRTLYRVAQRQQRSRPIIRQARRARSGELRTNANRSNAIAL